MFNFPKFFFENTFTCQLSLLHHKKIFNMRYNPLQMSAFGVFMVDAPRCMINHSDASGSAEQETPPIVNGHLPTSALN